MNIRISLLKILSAWFLVIPVYLFLIAWVKPVIGIPVIALLGLAHWQYQKSVSDDKATLHIVPWQLILLFFLCCWWVSFSGVGGYGLVLHDHHKTYSIARDVIDQQMPVSYEVEGKTYYLASYIAYYLVAPLLGGFLGYTASTTVLFVYISCGVFISMLWFAFLSRKNMLPALLAFVLIGGFDLAGFFFQNGLVTGIQKLREGESLMLYWYNSLDQQKYLLYHGNTNLLFWAAPHAITAWIISGVFFYDFLEKQSLKSSPFYLFTAVFWSPFILIGVFPYFLYQLYREGIKPYINRGNVLLIPAFLLLVWFVNSVGVSDLQKGWAFLPYHGLKPLAKDMFRLLWFIVFEVGIWLVFVWTADKTGWSARSKTAFVLLLIILAGIPFYRLGKYNDWVQRVSLPSLFLLWVFVLRSAKPGWRSWAAGLMIALSSLDSLAWLYQSVRYNGVTFDHHPLPYAEVRTMPQASLENGWPLEQVLAPADSPFFKYIAKSKFQTKSEGNP